MADKIDYSELTGLKKSEVLNQLKGKDTWTSKEVIHMLSTMRMTASTKVRFIRVGDVFFHKGLRHFAIVVKCFKEKDEYLSVLTTSNSDCVANIDKCRSRFFEGGYITMTCTKASYEEIHESFVFNYENKAHLKEITSRLKKYYTKNEML